MWVKLYAEMDKAIFDSYIYSHLNNIKVNEELSLFIDNYTE